jgi:sialate O-acetylesterase
MLRYHLNKTTGQGTFKPQPWLDVTPKTLGGGFSALCWYAGKHLYDRLGGRAPVGLIIAAIGGSPIEYWVDKQTIQTCESDDDEVSQRL